MRDTLPELAELSKPSLIIHGDGDETSIINSSAKADSHQGVFVGRVRPGGRADLAGIREESGTMGLEKWDGDVIVSIDSIKMTSVDDLIAYLVLNTAPGDDIVVGVYRDGVEIAIPIVLGSMPSTT